MTFRLQNSRGSALMGSLIGATILGVMAAAFATLMGQYQDTMRSLDQKMAIIQIRQMVLGTLANSAICTCNFDADKNPAVPALRFDPATTTSIALPQLHLACDAAGNPTDPHYQVGQPVSGTPGLVVSAVKLGNIQRVGPVGSSNYLAEALVEFDPARMKIARQPASVAVNLQLDLTIPTQARIASCAAGAGGSGGGGGGLGDGLKSDAIQIISAGGTGRTVAQDCPAGTRVISCVARCTNYHTGGARISGNGCVSACDKPGDDAFVDVVCVKSD
jgi:Tfp pilus assembly protein PilV